MDLMESSVGRGPVPMDFTYYLPVNIVFGFGKADKVGELTRPWGKKALIVTGRSSAKKSGLYDRVNGSLRAAGLETALFDKVAQNPLTTTAEEGAAFAREQGCDVVVAIGGGSIIDCAKGIAFMAENDGDINDYIFNRRRSDRALPLILIPTTCGTGSEGNGFAVLTNPATGDKKSLRCNAIVAKASIVDPACMMTMPKPVLASVGFDALCHVMEAYTSKIAQPFTDALCLYAISLLAENLPALYNGSTDRDAWGKATIASTIGGMAINQAGVTLAHGIEHPASGLRDIVHGRGLAALTPAVIEASYAGAPWKFGQISRLLGLESSSIRQSALNLIRTSRTYMGKMQLPATIKAAGVSKEDFESALDAMAESALADRCTATNPRECTAEEIKAVFRKAYEGKLP